MRQSTCEGVAEQLDLFRPMVTRPLWSRLPAPVREEVLELLAQMITDHARGSDLANGQEAIGDE